MKRACDQLDKEVTCTHLAAFLQSGGTLEVGKNFSLRAFARIRKGNRTVVVDTAYRDFTAILKEMDSKARDWYSIPYEHGNQEVNE